MAISDTWLKSSNGKARDGVLEKADRDGLSVRISALGKIKFQMRYRFAGKNQRCDIGTYPLMSLSDARIECQRYRAALELGEDPRVVKRVDRSQKTNDEKMTLPKVFELWYQAYAIDAKKGYAEIKRTFEIHVFPAMEGIEFNKITLHQWLTVLEGLSFGYDVKPKWYPGRGKFVAIPNIAERVLVNAKQIYRWAKKRHLCSENVLIEISAVHDLRVKKNIDDRSLDNDEIKLFYEAIHNSRMTAKNALFLELLLHFGCRPGELREALKSDFDFQKRTWTVPPEKHKVGATTGKPLVRPIIEEVEPTIRTLMDLSPGKYLVTNRDSADPLSRSAVIALPGNIMQWVRKNKGIEMPHWSTYALRKTCRTNLSDLCPPHVAEIIVGHKLPGEWQVYDHYQYLPEQAAAYKAWWERLERIRNPEKFANVVELKRG